MSYNGWTNYETWAVALWLDNEPFSHDWALDMAKDYRAEPACALADAMRDELDETRPDVPGMWADLLGAAFGAVDWLEIARHFKEQAEETGDREGMDREMLETWLRAMNQIQADYTDDDVLSASCSDICAECGERNYFPGSHPRGRSYWQCHNCFEENITGA